MVNLAQHPRYVQWTAHMKVATGAPECYRGSSIERAISLKITSKCDIWSLGAIFSEAASWMVGGFGGLQEYRERRVAAHEKIPKFEDPHCFHDGEHLLEVVSSEHKDCRKFRRTCDVITDKFLDVSEEMLYDDPKVRTTAIQALRHTEKAILSAEETLRNEQARDSPRYTNGTGNTNPGHIQDRRITSTYSSLSRQPWSDDERTDWHTAPYHDAYASGQNPTTPPQSHEMTLITAASRVSDTSQSSHKRGTSRILPSQAAQRPSHRDTISSAYRSPSLEQSSPSTSVQGRGLGINGTPAQYLGPDHHGSGEQEYPISGELTSSPVSEQGQPFDSPLNHTDKGRQWAEFRSQIAMNSDVERPSPQEELNRTLPIHGTPTHRLDVSNNTRPGQSYTSDVRNEEGPSSSVNCDQRRSRQSQMPFVSFHEAKQCVDNRSGSRRTHHLQGEKMLHRLGNRNIVRVESTKVVFTSLT